MVELNTNIICKNLQEIVSVLLDIRSELKESDIHKDKFDFINDKIQDTIIGPVSYIEVIRSEIGKVKE